jgi:hypothetical protein
MLQNGVASISRNESLPAAPASGAEPELPLFETMILPAIDPDSACSADEDSLELPSTPGIPEPKRENGKLSKRQIAALLVIAVTAFITLGVIWSRRPTASVVSSSVPAAPVTPPIVSSDQPVLVLPVAQITHAVGAQWETGNGQMQPFRDIPAQSRLLLIKGYVELTFNNTATAVFEAPAEFTVVSNREISMESGRVAANVPPQAHGFSVVTHQGTITDLGTEFGVVTAAGGPTQFDVFKGSVSVDPGSLNKGAPAVFVAGQAAVVKDGTIKVDPAGASSQRYVRSFSSNRDHLDLVDLMCGGDGTTQKTGMAIDANTGETGMDLKPVGELAGSGSYHRVTAVSVIDGSFVPDGTKGQMQVDSAGHSFAFPSTTGHSFNRIWTGGVVPWPADQQPVSTVADGVDYSQSPHRLIEMHSNQAMTMDLAAIRRLHADEPLTQFKCGVVNTYAAAPSRFDVYVIVDGVARFNRQAVVHSDGKIDVSVPLQAKDRYLTLVTTDGDKSIWGDWAVWCDPVLLTGRH